MKKFSLILIFLVSTLVSKAQLSLGTTGYMTTPTAEMREDGLFSVGINYMPEALTPSGWDYNTANYFFNLTFLPFLEATFRCTIMDMYNGSVNQDRSFSLRFRALKERRFIPAIVIGSNDIITSSELELTEFSDSNKYFASLYVVMTKHFETKFGVFGVNLGLNATPTREPDCDVFFGADFKPKFAPWLSFMGEFDKDRKVNLGVSSLLFGHLGIHAFCYDFKNFSAGLRYEIVLF